MERGSYKYAARFFWAAVTGLLLTVSFPPFGAGLTAYISLIPLLFAVSSCSPKEGLLLGYIAGLTHYMTLLHWVLPTMNTYGNLPLVLCVPVLFLLASYLSCYTAVFASAMVWSARGRAVGLLCVAPFLWVSLEYVRTFLFSGFPWSLLGYSQAHWVNLVQIADITGVYGISFIVVAVNIALFFMVLGLFGRKWQGRKIGKKNCLIGLVVVGGLMAAINYYGEHRIDLVDRQMAGADHFAIAVVQGNVDQAHKWDIAWQERIVDKYLRLSGTVKGADLIVWPETAVPFYYDYDERLTNRVESGITNKEASFIIGSPSFDRNRELISYFNSAYLTGPAGEILGRYDKVHLVPFGEYIPFRTVFPFLGKMVEQAGDFMPGNEGQALKWRQQALGMQTCFEIIFPGLSRAMARGGAGVLINITNDAWFGTSGAPYQHFSMAAFRAIENRRFLVRAANTGISGFVDPVGRVVAQTGLFEEAVLTKNIPFIYELSWYSRFGDVFVFICMGFLAAFILFRKLSNNGS